MDNGRRTTTTIGMWEAGDAAAFNYRLLHLGTEIIYDVADVVNVLMVVMVVVVVLTTIIIIIVVVVVVALYLMRR